MRTAELSRKTKETDIVLALNLEGGERSINTGIGFFDHTLDSFAAHGRFGLAVRCKGDLQVDGHHTVEDIGIVLGQAFREALGDKSGIERFAHAFVPMDEALAGVFLDISGRPFLHIEGDIPGGMAGGYDSQLTGEFLRAFAINAGITLHVKIAYGKNIHHIVEAIFKALARALKAAVTITSDEIMSTKGWL